MMKLYHFPHSPNSRKVRATARLLGLDLDEEVVDLVAGAQKAPEFLAINPNGMVPVLVDGDLVLWESNAIMQYLASTVPGATLLPEGAAARADVTRWQCWQLAHWGPATSTIIGERLVKRLTGGGEPDESAVAKAEEDVHRFAAVLDAHLAGREFLVGDGLTVADLAVAAPLAYAETAGLPVDGYPNIMRWYAAIDRLEAWRSTAV